MAMVLEAVVDKSVDLLADFVQKKAIMLLGVNDELQRLRELMKNIQCLLKDAEKKRFNESSSTELWLSKLKDVMYDAEDIIDLCRIEGTLLADQNPESKITSVCCDFSSVFSCFISFPFRHEIGNRIKDINENLKRIYENRKCYKLEKSTISESPQFTLVDSRQTSSMDDPFVVGREIDVAANNLVDCLVGEKVDEKCRLFAVTGMGGIGKTTLAQKIFNHSKIQSYFDLKVWICVSQTYSETELLKQVIRGAKGRYGKANTKSELQTILSVSFTSHQSFFLVLDDVWRADVWVDLLRVPLYNSNKSVRILITTRDEIVAKEMKAAYIHPVTHLSKESSWDMFRRRLLSVEEEVLANDLKELGLKIVTKCKGLPLAIKVIAGVLARKEHTKKVWESFLKNDVWSISKLPEELRGALYLSFEDLPSHMKQCFLYFSLYREDKCLDYEEFAQLWVAEGFVAEHQDSLMEDLAKEYFNELLKRNLLMCRGYTCVMHDVIRSLAIFLSKEETSFGRLNVRNSMTSIKLRRLSVADQKAAVEILNSVVDKGTLRTLLASNSDLLLDNERLRQLSHLRVLDISITHIQILPDSIGKLVHLRYLNLTKTQIRAIPESIGKLTNLQFLAISYCVNLRQLPSTITRLYNLRRIDMLKMPVSSIPKGIEKLQQLNYLSGFVVANNDSSSKLEDLNSLKQIRTLNICNLKRAQSETIILEELPNLSTLTLEFSADNSIPSEEQEEAVEELFDKIKPPQILENIKIVGFFGRRFPNWMDSSSLEIYFQNLTKLVFTNIKACNQLPSLGQLPELRMLDIEGATIVKKIGPEFFGRDANSTRIAFPKLEHIKISSFPKLEEWSFVTQDEQTISSRLKLLPCLHAVEINKCPLLKQLPKGLEHSTMKFLKIFGCISLESIDNLPSEIEDMRLLFCARLKKIYCAPTLKRLEILECRALSCMEKLDSLQKLSVDAIDKESLPEWLLKLLQQWGLQNYSNNDFELSMSCNVKVLPEFLEGGSYWGLIQHIPRVHVHAGKHYLLRYSKQPPIYATNL